MVLSQVIVEVTWGEVSTCCDSRPWVFFFFAYCCCWVLDVPSGPETRILEFSDKSSAVIGCPPGLSGGSSSFTVEFLMRSSESLNDQQVGVLSLFLFFYSLFYLNPGRRG